MQFTKTIKIEAILYDGINIEEVMNFANKYEKTSFMSITTY